MHEFTYTARLQDGTTHKGTISAENKAAALQQLRNRHMKPISIQEAKAKGLSMEIKLPGSDAVKSKDLVVFTRQFSVMIDAGVPILRALTILKDQSESPALKKVLETVTADVQGGTNLSDALEKHSKIFNTIYVNMVRAGEAGGILDQVLRRLAFQQEKDAALKGKIKSAMVYPSVVGSVTAIAFFVLMTFIVPKIGNILTQMSSMELPIYTRALLAISNLLKQPVFMVGAVVVIVVLVVAFRRWAKTEKGRYQWHSLLLRAPVISTLITKTAIARFSRIFASLLGSGVSIVSALETTAGSIGNAVIEKELMEASRAIQTGSQLSVELAKSKHFPPIVSQMLAVGEETGQTDSVILKVAEFYEEEVDAAVGSISSIIEPVMILVLGGMVGLIAVSVFGPITQLSTGAQ